MSHTDVHAATESVNKKTQQPFSWGSNPDLYKGTPLYEVPQVDFSMNLGQYWSLTTSITPWDGASGLHIFNSVGAAFQIDGLNNIIFSAGKPSQGGCGGKMIENVQSKLTKAGSIATEVTGREDAGVLNKTKNEEGNIEKEKLPAYSLKVYGDILIECVGGDVAIKGDNVTVNALSSLNLKSEKDLNIQANGNINMSGSNVDMKSGSFKKNLTIGEFTTGGGESSTEQYKPGATIKNTTPGAVEYTVSGNYTVGVKGNYTLGVDGNSTIKVKKDLGYVIEGNHSSLIKGKSKEEIQGGGKSTQLATLLMKVGASKSKKTPGFDIKSNSGVGIQSTAGGFSVSAFKGASTFKMEEKSVKLTKSKLGFLEMTEKGTEIGFGKTSRISMGVEKLIATNKTGIYLN